MSVWYLELDDEITDAVARLRAAKDDRVVFVVPAGSRIGTGRINFRLLAREAVSRGLRIALVSGDPQVRALAASAGLPTYASVAESERGAATEGPLRLDTAADEPSPDATSATATITTAPGPGSGVRAAGSRPVRRPRSRRQKAAITIGALGLVALVGGGSLLALYRSVPTATITLALAPRAFGPVPLAITVSASTPTDPETGTVQGQLEPVTVTGEAVVTASETRDLSDRARGSVTFTNASDAPVPIPDLTAVATPDGIRFLTQASIQAVEPGGTATVEVRAERAGGEGNVEPNTITVIVDERIAAQLGEGGGVTNPEATTGGSDADQTYFTQADYDQAVERLRAQLREQLATVVPDARPGIIAFPGTAHQVDDVVVEQAPEDVVGRVGPETTITGTLQGNVLTVSREQLMDVATRMLATAATPDSLVPGGARVELGEPAIEPTRATYKAIGDAVVYGLHVSIADLREQVRSRTIPEARRILEAHGTATIILSPDFLPALPDDPSRIEIRPEPPSPGATPVPMTSPTPSPSAGAASSPQPSPGGSVGPTTSAPVPSAAPSVVPSAAPSGVPGIAPSLVPSGVPSIAPSGVPSIAPSVAPSARASQEPAA